MIESGFATGETETSSLLDWSVPPDCPALILTVLSLGIVSHLVLIRPRLAFGIGGFPKLLTTTFILSSLAMERFPDMRVHQMAAGLSGEMARVFVEEQQWPGGTAV